MRERRRAAIMAAALDEATRYGYSRMTREGIARVAGVAVGSINHEFGTMDGLRDAVMAEAVASRRLEIVAQGLVDCHVAALNAPAELRTAAVRQIA